MSEEKYNLQTLRINYSLSIEQVARDTNIPAKVIDALEKECYAKLPEQVYVIGFIKKLADYYSVDRSELLSQFEFQDESKSIPKRNIASYFSLPSIVITPKMTGIFVALFSITGAFGWLVWQLVSIQTSPRLIVNQPTTGAIIRQSFIKVEGTTDKGATLTINKEKVQVGDDGNFSAVLSLTSGSKQLIFEAVSKFNKTTLITVPVAVDVPGGDNLVLENLEPRKLQLAIEVKKDLPISLTVDGEIQPTETLTNGSRKNITARQKIVLLTPDAGNTFVKINDQDLGPVGKIGQTLTIPFTLESVPEVSAQDQSIRLYNKN